ncbi:MAG: hypothetical protein ACLUV3_07555, partial [Oscillospiraceae bacterium]
LLLYHLSLFAVHFFSIAPEKEKLKSAFFVYRKNKAVLVLIHNRKSKINLKWQLNLVSCHT